MEEKRERWAKNAKRAGTVMAYVGTASLMRPFVSKAREDQSGAMQACTIFSGTVLSIGLGKIATKFMNDTIDKVMDFIDDVKPKKKEEKKPEAAGGEQKNG